MIGTVSLEHFDRLNRTAELGIFIVDKVEKIKSNMRNRLTYFEKYDIVLQIKKIV